MKVPELKTTQQVTAPAKAGTEGPVRSVAPVETISTAQSARLTETLASVKSQAPVDRAQRIADIAKAIKSGQYHVNAQQIAEQIVDDADLDAKLQQMLKGT